MQSQHCIVLNDQSAWMPDMCKINCKNRDTTSSWKTARGSVNAPGHADGQHPWARLGCSRTSVPCQNMAPLSSPAPLMSARGAPAGHHMCCLSPPPTQRKVQTSEGREWPPTDGAAGGSIWALDTARSPPWAQVTGPACGRTGELRNMESDPLQDQTCSIQDKQMCKCASGQDVMLSWKMTGRNTHTPQHILCFFMANSSDFFRTQVLDEKLDTATLFGRWQDGHPHSHDLHIKNDAVMPKLAEPTIIRSVSLQDTLVIASFSHQGACIIVSVLSPKGVPEPAPWVGRAAVLGMTGKTSTWRPMEPTDGVAGEPEEEDSQLKQRSSRLRHKPARCNKKNENKGCRKPSPCVARETKKLKEKTEEKLINDRFISNCYHST